MECFYRFVTECFREERYHFVVAFVNAKSAVGSTEKYVMQTVFCDGQDDVAFERLRMEVVVTEHLDVVSVVAAETVDCAVP
jgi:hypothetical protein